MVSNSINGTNVIVYQHITIQVVNQPPTPQVDESPKKEKKKFDWNGLMSILTKVVPWLLPLIPISSG